MYVCFSSEGGRLSPRKAGVNIIECFVYVERVICGVWFVFSSK